MVESFEDMKYKSILDLTRSLLESVRRIYYEDISPEWNENFMEKWVELWNDAIA